MRWPSTATVAAVGSVLLIAAGCGHAGPAPTAQSAVRSTSPFPATLSAPPDTPSRSTDPPLGSNRPSPDRGRTNAGPIAVAQAYLRAFYGQSWHDRDQFAYVTRVRPWITRGYATALATAVAHGNNGTANWTADRAEHTVTTATPQAVRLDPEASRTTTEVWVIAAVRLLTTRRGGTPMTTSRPAVLHLQLDRGAWLVDADSHTGG